MFKFDFKLEEEDEEELNLPGPSSRPVQPPSEVTFGAVSQPCYLVTLDELIDLLPETISYSPIHVPSLKSPMLRRDLYDARFQLTQRDVPGGNKEESESKTSDKEEEQGEAYVDSSTDLVPGLYEGGLKTWEGGVDLVEVLSEVTKGQAGKWVRGATVLEVGCGTALPSAYLLNSILSSSSEGDASPRTTLHLQDFNKPVLSLVTLPNLILASLPFLAPESLKESDEAEIEDVLPDLEVPGTLSITPAVKYAFKTLLGERGIQLEFTYGHWSGLSHELEDTKGYDLVLTSETIYAEDSVEDLLAVLKEAYRTKEGTNAVSLEDSLGNLNLQKWAQAPLIKGTETVVLVAAKVLYFGVGGGLQAFLGRVENQDGWTERVKDWTLGVGRRVVRIGWS